MAFLQSQNIRLNMDPTGGRILSLVAFGEELFFSNNSCTGDRPGFPSGSVSEDEWRAFKRYYGFKLFGGDKTWVSPEYSWWERIPPLELDAGQYCMEQLKDTVVMTSPHCRETGLQIVRTVRLDPIGKVFLKEEIVNISDRPVTRGIWNVSQVLRPFTVFFPGAVEQFRSYNYQDPTLPSHSVTLIGHKGLTGIPCQFTECYKFGGIPSDGYSILFKPILSGRIVWERWFKVYPDRPYAHNSAVEVFNSHLYNYGEVEIHSPLATLGPGERLNFEQEWAFGKLDNSSSFD